LEQIQTKKVRIPPGDYNIILKTLRIRYDGKATLFYEIAAGEYKGTVMKAILQRKPITSMKGNPK
jgi:hypothetical protein